MRSKKGGSKREGVGVRIEGEERDNRVWGVGKE